MTMDEEEVPLYPWAGDFVPGNPESPVAVVTLSGKLKLDMGRVAIAGPMKTENLGVEKVVANVISNPRVRFLIVAGEEVRGHRSGHTIQALHANGVDEKGRVVGARGAVPYIENLEPEARDRFRAQVEIVDMVGTTDPGAIVARADELASRDPGSFGEPFIAVEFTERKGRGGTASVAGALAFHSTLVVDPYCEVTAQALENGGADDADGADRDPGAEGGDGKDGASEV